MPDKYPDMQALKAAKRCGKDYTIVTRIKERYPIAILAPHGGMIECGTSILAKLIAGNDYRLYLFEGIMQNQNFSELHVTSHNFNECRALALVRKCQIAVTVHGRADKGDPETIWLGGLHTSLSDQIADHLRDAEFKVTVDGPAFLGLCPMNICNRTRSGAGVQIEIPKALRKLLIRDANLRGAFVSAIRSALKSYYE